MIKKKTHQLNDESFSFDRFYMYFIYYSGNVAPVGIMLKSNIINSAVLVG